MSTFKKRNETVHSCGPIQVLQPYKCTSSILNGPSIMAALRSDITQPDYVDLLTQTGQRHSSQMDGLHRVRPLVQCPHELEVEDPTDQAANAAGGEEDHLKGKTNRTNRQERTVRIAALPTPHDICGASQSDKQLVCLQLTNRHTGDRNVFRIDCTVVTTAFILPFFFFKIKCLISLINHNELLCVHKI